MRILLVNPPFHLATTAYGLGAQVPLGLVLVGGALLERGHDVTLIDAEARHLPIQEIVEQAKEFRPDVIMTGHAGSTAAHPVTIRMARALKTALPETMIVYGGVFPTYNGRDILAAEPAIDVIVKGEGEQTIVNLVSELEKSGDLTAVIGIIYRDGATIRETAPAEMMPDLDHFRAGWELIEDWDLYHCWGLGRAAVVQFSRGCPHACTYCGQRGFWTKWRYRDPIKLAAEIAWLHREKQVNFVDLADENPTSSKRQWRVFLEALIAENVPVKMFATIRAADIVRDADILPLYKKAGIDCVLMGMETTDPATMVKIRKGSTTRTDLEAIRLLRKHRILSMVGHIVGFEEERFRDYWNALRQLMLYDPDLLNAMYVTPHRWTGFYGESRNRNVVESDQSKWDYRHQVLGTRNLKPWHIFVLVKATELAVHLRPRALWRVLFYKDDAQRRAYRWCFGFAGRVWLREVYEFWFKSTRTTKRQSLVDYAGEPIVAEAALVPMEHGRSPYHR